MLTPPCQTCNAQTGAISRTGKAHRPANGAQSTASHQPA